MGNAVTGNTPPPSASTRAAFSGGVAVITGAGSGIGEALARACALMPMRVVIADIDSTRADGVAQSIRASGGEAIAVATDVTDPTALDRLAAITHEKYGDVRLLINNAGIETVGYCWEIPAQRWEQALGVNVHGPIHGVRAFVPRMIASGEKAYVVNVASIAAVCMAALQAPYVATKHAVLSFSECLLLDLQLCGAPIQVSAVAPGSVATRIFTDAPENAANPIAAAHRAQMQGLIAAHGMAPAAAAELILEKVAAGEFWITTDPAMLRAYAAERADYLSALARPAFNADSRALLGINTGPESERADGRLFVAQE